MESTIFGKTSSGEVATLFTLRNTNGLIVRVTNYGAAILQVHTPDRDGKLKDITLGFDEFAAYLNNDPFFGVVAGRYANRIARGQFKLDGRDYQLAINNGPNHLHGGTRGFNTRFWSPEELSDKGKEGIRLIYESPDQEEGYPGKITVKIDYHLTDSNELRIDYQAISDAPTPINLTNHSYWNLGGEGSGHIGDHELTVNADLYTKVDETLIPTGEIHSVRDTPLDFRTPTRIGDRIAEVGYDPKGYDHNYVLNKSEIGAVEIAASVRHQETGRQMEVWTSEPGIQFYTANFLDGSLTGKSGTPYEKQDGFCLECQHFPDSPNQAHFPTTILTPETVYRQTTIHRFSNDG